MPKATKQKINVDKINLKTSPFFCIAFIGGYLLSGGNDKNLNILRFIRKGLENTDKRVQVGEPVTPMFLYAILITICSNLINNKDIKL